MKKMRQLNWSYAIQKFTRSGASDKFDNLSDFDCMAINIGVKEKESVKSVDAPRFIYLDEFIVDIDNMIAF